MKKTLLIVIGLGISLNVCPEVIKFKNGKTVEGDITQRDATSVMVDTSGIALTYYLDEIDSIDGVGIGAASSPRIQGQKDVAVGKKTFKDSAWGYSLEYPSDWEIIPDDVRKNQYAAGFRPTGQNQRFATLIVHRRSLRSDELDKVKDIRALAKLFPPPAELRLIKEETLTVNKEPAYHARYAHTIPYTIANIEGSTATLSGETTAYYDYYYCSPAFSSGGADKRLFVFFSQYVQYSPLSESANAAVSRQILEKYKNSYEAFNRTIEGLSLQLTNIVLSLRYSAISATPDLSDVGQIPAPNPLSLGKIKEAYDFLRQADDYARQGKYEDALGQLTKVIEMDSQSAEAYRLFGEIYMSLGRYEESTRAYKKCISIAPNYANAYAELGYLYIKTGNDPEALVILQKALQLNPELTNTQFLLGSLYVQFERYEEAITLLEKAAPKIGSVAYSGLGSVYRNVGRLEKAVTAFKKAITEDEGNDDAYYGLGLTYAQLNRFSEAKVSLQQALTILKERKDDKDAFRKIQEIDDFLKKIP